jgi:hypothetical protein
MREPLLEQVGGGVAWRVYPGTVDVVGLDELTYDYRVELAVVDQDGRGRVVVRSVDVVARGGGDIATRTVAGELAKVRRVAVTALSVKWKGDGERITPLGKVSGGDVRSAMKGKGRGPAAPGDLADVASVYKRAARAGHSTTAAVAGHFGLSATNARQRVYLARRAGLLPAAHSTRPPRG